MITRVGNVLYVLCVPQITERRILQRRSEFQGEMPYVTLESTVQVLEWTTKEWWRSMGRDIKDLWSGVRRVTGLQSPSYWKGQTFWEHGGSPTGMCAHTPANLFSLNRVTHHAPYCLIPYCTITETILLHNRRIMTKIWKFNMDTIIHFSPYSNYSIIVPITSYVAVLFLSSITPQRPSARGNWWHLRHLLWTPVLCWGSPLLFSSSSVSPAFSSSVLILYVWFSKPSQVTHHCFSV